MRAKIAAVSILCIAISGCKPIKEAINDTLNDGTVEGVSQCVELTSNELLSADTVRNRCVARFEKDISYITGEKVTGKAGPSSQYGTSYFSGAISNSADEYVVTEISVEVEFRENRETEGKKHSVVIDGWFEPTGSLQDFKSAEVLNPPENWGKVPKCKDTDEGPCWEGWWLVSIKGLKL
jgi:hypothetical protein